jgi:hypothetical protein
LKKYLPLFLILIALLPAAARAQEEGSRQSKATLVVEYGLDSLERRYYHPTFHFDFPIRGGNVFSEVQYLSRMNGRLQGAIDYWVNVGVQKTIREKLKLELRLNHFCRHTKLRSTPYIWNLNEVLGGVGLSTAKLDLSLAFGGYTGGSEGYRELAVVNGEWRGFLIPEMALSAEVKWVNFSRLYHEFGFALALNRHVELFFKNSRQYEFPTMSYLGLRYKSTGKDETALASMKMMVGASPFDDVFKLEVAGGFKFEFFADLSRRVILGVDFESPILNGDGFFAQFWPAKMIYDIGLDYEKKVGPNLFAVWANRYRADMPVDVRMPFTASLFTGVALRNQADFDEFERAIRFEVAAGYNFKRGLEFSGKLGALLCRNNVMKLAGELTNQVDGKRVRADFRLLADFSLPVQLRPYVGWKKDFYLDATPPVAGRILFGLGFFKKF